MMMLMLAAAAAAQAAPANAPAQRMPMQHEQHDGMKKKGCDCCKDMEAKHDASDHAEHAAH